MKIQTGEKGEIILKEVFSGVTLETEEGNRLSICMRDSGFDINYNGKLFSTIDGKIQERPIVKVSIVTSELSTCPLTPLFGPNECCSE